MWSAELPARCLPCSLVVNLRLQNISCSSFLFTLASQYFPLVKQIDGVLLAVLLCLVVFHLGFSETFCLIKRWIEDFLWAQSTFLCTLCDKGACVKAGKEQPNLQRVKLCYSFCSQWSSNASGQRSLCLCRVSCCFCFILAELKRSIHWCVSRCSEAMQEPRGWVLSGKQPPSAGAGAAGPAQPGRAGPARFARCQRGLRAVTRAPGPCQGTAAPGPTAGTAWDASAPYRTERAGKDGKGVLLLWGLPWQISETCKGELESSG